MLFERPDDDTLYDALIARSADYEGQAYVCVKTTGIFCRLTCPARKPKREKYALFRYDRRLHAFRLPPVPALQAAGATGQGPIVDELLAALDREPQLRWTEDELVRRGHDPSTVRRAFKRALGMTFHDIVRYRRLGEAARQLADGARVIDAQRGGI
ncbi:Ada metal-binding domain-containing protein [Rhizobium beringeri]